MCGIMGGNIKEWNYQKGIERIRHRGPDGRKVLQFEECTLAFTRLAIMDLSDRAMQPLESPDGNVVLLFNGEIYGFDTLRNQLKQKYHFTTTSDTEVILYAYIEYGDTFIDYIDGMFAIVIYDKREQLLKLYRDRYGIKPLYYLYRNQQFAFASELKAFVAAIDGNSTFVIDKTAIYDYLAYQYIPEPKSLYQNIYKLEPATYLYYDLKRKKIIKKAKYWNLRINTKAHGNKKRREVLDDIRELVHISVKKQMIADVPVGVFLSGGVDSSAVSYECSKIHPDVNSFSIGFENRRYDESDFARKAAEVCGIPNILQVLSAEDISNLKGTLADLFDEPFGDTTAYPTLLVSKLARKKVKVVLTGDGGDEIFGGYERYRWFIEGRKERLAGGEKLENFLKKSRFVGSVLKGNTIRKLEGDLSAYGRFLGFFEQETYKGWRKKLHIDEEYDSKWFLRKYYHKELPLMTRMRYLDFKTYLPGDVLTKTDRTAMRTSLEARVPFLDRDLVEYVFSLAQDEYFYGNELKTILKKAYEDVLPEDILYRKKQGFAVPDNYIGVGNCTSFERLLKSEWKDMCGILL